MTVLVRFTVVILAGLLGLGAGVAASQLVAVGSPPAVVIEYQAFENTIRLTSKMDFADTKVTFDDLPGRWVTVKELRDWVKARPVLKTPP